MLTKDQEKQVEDYVINRLENFNPSEYWSKLWDWKLIGSQGPWTLDYLVKNHTVTSLGADFANKHFENDASNVDDTLRHSFYLEVIHGWALDSIKEAEAGNKDYDWLMEFDEEERFDQAFAEAAEDMNYEGLRNFLAYLADAKIYEIVGIEKFHKILL